MTGTQATMIFAGGLTETLPTFHVRLTEYTVGEAGPQAMPGELPPQSGYTYAAEYSVDEAVAAGALNVELQPAADPLLAELSHLHGRHGRAGRLL